jgi:hypothetical protein
VSGDYPERVSIGRNIASERQVITILELDMSAAEFQARRSELACPDAPARLAEIVDTTGLEGLYEEVLNLVGLLEPAETRACPVDLRDRAVQITTVPDRLKRHDLTDERERLRPFPPADPAGGRPRPGPDLATRPAPVTGRALL